SSWLEGWDKQGYAAGPGDGARLEVMRTLLSVLRDAAAADAGGPAVAALNATAVWEASRDAAAELCGDLADACSRASAAMGEGDTDKCGQALGEIREKRAAGLLLGRLARSAAPGPASALL